MNLRTVATRPWFALAGVCLLLVSGCGQQSSSTVVEEAGEQSSAPGSSATPESEATPVEVKAPATAPRAAAASAPSAVAKPSKASSAPQEKAPAVRPASLRTAIETINLAELPAPRGAEYQERTAAAIMLQVPLKLSAAFDYYLSALTKRGWTEDTSGNQRQIAEQYAQTALVKDGFRLWLYTSPASDQPDEAQVMIRNHGNVDSRRLPAPAGAKQLYGSAGSTIYITERSVMDATQACRQDLAQSGWQEFGPPFAARAESEEQQFLTFRQEGIELTVMINQAPAQDNKTAVHYNVTLLAGDLPWPADSEDVEFDDGRMYLTYRSPQSLSQLVDYYEEQLAELAWSSRGDFKQVNDTTANLYFDDANQNRLMVQIHTPDEGPRTVKIERLTAAEVQAIAEQVRRNELANQSTHPASSDPDADAAEVAKSQIAARDLKLPQNAKGVAYESNSGEISFTTTDLPTRVTEFFRDQLVGEDWKEDRRFSVVSDDAAVFEFKGAGDSGLSFTLIRFPDADGTRVTISGDGLAWSGKTDRPARTPQLPEDEPLADENPAPVEPAVDAAEEELVAEDKDGYPVPSGYSSYSTEKTPFRKTITVSKSAPLAKVLEFYRRELTAGGWKEEVKGAAIADEQASLQFTGPPGKLGVKLSRANDETQVELFTRSEAAAKKAGILPKPGQARLVFGNTLKSNVSITVDGKTVKLRPGEGEKKPDGPALDLAPGTYQLKATIDGQDSTEEVTVEADQTWGVIVLDLGVLPLLMY